MKLTVSFGPVAVAGLLIGALGAADAHAQFSRVSVATDGTTANGSSNMPSINGDGRYVAFSSAATNLVAGDTNLSADVFLRDRQTNTTARISVTSSGEERAGASYAPTITPDGRFILFKSEAALAAEDANGTGTDLYVHDRNTGTTTRVGIVSDGTQSIDLDAVNGFTADGRFVLFTSETSTLVPNDTNGRPDLFLHDRQAATTTRVSTNTDGGQLASGSFNAQISRDGRFIVYGGQLPAAAAPHPEPCAVADACPVVFLRVRESGEVTRLSTSFPTIPTSDGLVSQSPTQISDDGRVVVIQQSHAFGHRRSVRNLLHDRLTGHSTADQGWVELGATSIVALSGDGRTYAAWGFTELSQHLFRLTDRVAGFDEIVDNPMPGPVTNDSDVRLSHDARFSAFSTVEALVPDDTTGLIDIYVYDRDVDADGMPTAWETRFGLHGADASDAAADADGDGVTSLQEYQRASHPTATVTRYFAEGAANAFFNTRLAALNPGDAAANVVFRFLGQNGEHTSLVRVLEPRTRTTIELDASGPAPGNDFSTVIESDRPIVADRTMSWDETGYGAHSETSLAAPSTTWHLAEGATHGAFDLFYLLQNPNQVDAAVNINYLRLAPLTPVAKTYVVPANSRRTIWVDREGADLEAVDVAAAITSDLPIIAERAMYSTRPGQPPFAAGHGGAGVTAPALRWFLAEGATGSFFDLYALVSNPGATASDITVTYLRPEGEPFNKTYTVGPQNRLTISVQGEDARLADTPVSIVVESTNNQPVVVERAMWWPKGEWYEAHLSAGATTTGTRWALADGEVTETSDTYILIANTSPTAGSATVTLLPGNMETVVTLPASSRVNVPVRDLLPASPSPANVSFSAIVESSGVEIVVERATYSSSGGVTWSAGTAALATKLP